MIWLEMSRDEAHGGDGWSFAVCLWSPSHKDPVGKWPFWESLLQIQEGDIVIHLRGGTHQQLFVGYSVADAIGYETKDRPPKVGEWGYARSYYRVPLRDFTPFSEPISLDTVFSLHDARLRAYFNANRSRSAKDKERLFYVVQSARLQCLNGAYCSEISIELAEILFGIDWKTYDVSSAESVYAEAHTREQLRQIATRVGQREFANLVKNNYGGKCCFPECTIDDSRFLVGAHIARWADAEHMRGKASNGVCFCLMHDKAFEIGIFTLSKNHQIVLNRTVAEGNQWAEIHIKPHAGKTISRGREQPSTQAIEMHWLRIGYSGNQASN